jgi:hypothetical protein
LQVIGVVVITTVDIIVPVVSHLKGMVDAISKGKDEGGKGIACNSSFKGVKDE